MIINDLYNNNAPVLSEGDVVPFRRAAVSWQKLPKDVLSLANDWFWADFEGGGLQATMDPKGLGSGFANQQKYLGAQLQQRGWAIDIDDEYENIVLKNQQGQTILLPIEDAQDFTGWAQGTNSVSEQGVAEGTEEDMPVHRIGLTVIDPQHPMVSKRKEQYQKSVRVPGHDREQAITSAINHLRRRGFKVLDHHYIGLLEASLGDYRKKAALSKATSQMDKFFGRGDPARVAQADQTIAKRERGMARADARAAAYTPPAAAPMDLEKQRRDLTAKYPNIDELVRRAELNRDPNYEMADGPAYYAARDAEQNYLKLKQIQRVIQGLNESLNRSHLP